MVGLPSNKRQRDSDGQTHLSTTTDGFYSCDIVVSGKLFEEKVLRLKYRRQGLTDVPNKVTIEGITENPN